MTANRPATGQGFPALLKLHRSDRKLSQLDLACEAGVSQRHLSYLETGRSRPSRAMVMALGRAMDVSLREQNMLLQAAGFAAQFAQRPLDHPDMDAINAALTRMLEHHLPYPAVVIDRRWNLLRSNAAMDALITMAGDPDALWARTCPDGSKNMARLTLHPNGIAANIVNAAEAVPLFLHRLRSDAVASGDAEELAFVQELFEMVPPDMRQLVHDQREQALLPVLPLVMEAGGMRMSLFTTITTFGTPQDVTTDDMRIELFYPADDATRQLLGG